jgi:GxxExxY protein
VGTGLRKLDTDWMTGQIIGGAIDVHRYLGPGMLEHTYEVCLEAALRQRGLQVERQVPVRVRCLDVNLDCGYRIDMLVERVLVVEVKQLQRRCPCGRRLEASSPKGVTNYVLRPLLHVRALRVTLLTF